MNPSGIPNSHVNKSIKNSNWKSVSPSTPMHETQRMEKETNQKQKSQISFEANRQNYRNGWTSLTQHTSSKKIELPDKGGVEEKLWGDDEEIQIHKWNRKGRVGFLPIFHFPLLFSPFSFFDPAMRERSISGQWFCLCLNIKPFY